MGHDRKLVIGGVALVKARFNNTGVAMDEVRDDIEKVLIKSDFFANAPFKWVGLIIRYGIENKFVPVYQRINRTHGDLPISVEVDSTLLLGADVERIATIFRLATIDALIHVAQRYRVPDQALREVREDIH